MKNLLILFSLLILTACGPTTPTVNQNNAAPPPQALQDNSYTSGSFKRGKGDLIEELYQELAEKNKDLAALNDQVEKLLEYGQDSLEQFNKYAANCEDYYVSARQRIAGIEDSLLKKRISEIVAGSSNRFYTTIAADTALKVQIQTKEKELRDVYTVLKVVKTLSVMEKYVKESKPSSASLQGLKKEYDILIRKVEERSK